MIYSDLQKIVEECKCVHSVKTNYNNMCVFENKENRYMMSMPVFKTDKLSLQGGMSLSNPREKVLPYYESMCDTIINLSPENNVLCIGLGAGFLPKEIRFLSNCNIDVVEIDLKVEEICRNYFELPKDINVYIDDGYNFVMNTSNKYDFIIVDAYCGNKIPFLMVTSDFFKKCKSILKEDGTISVNLSRYHCFYYSHLKSIMSVFGEKLFANDGIGNVGNVIIHNKRDHDFVEGLFFKTKVIFMNDKIMKSKVFRYDMTGLNENSCRR